MIKQKVAMSDKNKTWALRMNVKGIPKFTGLFRERRDPWLFAASMLVKYCGAVWLEDECQWLLGEDHHEDPADLVEAFLNQTPGAFIIVFSISPDDRTQLLIDAHNQLLRLVCTFVSDQDGAHKQTCDLMRKIRDACPGHKFEGGSDA